MRYSDNYELNLVEGSDIVNPLIQDVPNYETIDAAMFDNKEHSVGVATELKTGTIHALTRQNEDAAVFRFTATSDYTVGDTFEVDGVQVSALLVDGTTLPNRCYIIGSEVLASLKGTLLTVYANRTTASDSDKLGGQLPAYYATDADLDNLEGVVDGHTDQISQLNSNLTVNVIEPSEYGGRIKFTKYGHLVICDVDGWNTTNGQTGQTVPVELRPSYNTYGTAHKSGDATGTALRYYEGYLQFLDDGITSYKTGVMYGQISWFI